MKCHRFVSETVLHNKVLYDTWSIVLAQGFLRLARHFESGEGPG